MMAKNDPNMASLGHNEFCHYYIRLQLVNINK